MYTEDSLVNNRAETLATHYWKPAGSVRALVFLSHGYSEHLGLYHPIASFLNEHGMYVFGHDHIGHGKSDGKRVYIENVDHYSDDVIQHCQLMKDKHPGQKLFIVGHSMGGMISVRATLMHKNFFNGMILNGPLIIPGPQILGMDLRATPARTFISRAILSLLSLAIPETAIGGPDLNIITRDKDMHEFLTKDDLRWTGGCKVRLLLAFVDCLDENINQLSDVRTPFLIIHGSDDSLCNPKGSDLLYRRSRSTDKELKVFPDSRHQLFLELPAARQEAFQDVANWIRRRC